TQYPLRKTPLNLILKRTVDLKDENMVVAHVEHDGETVIVAQDPEHPEYGSIRLHFTEAPVALTKWVIRDEVGGETAVHLESLETG
ncbi:MAG: outer membrane lipoprotein carrier protein LolA, partial [Candidatus Latescibacteria bacterium]|nr:outer membrane lipoprotein carrier protein LolA [Candidatus Latescibacterota bacterium]NIM65786.1 outer membrane lipoprotein carrier protein LolA [Candidatus Latescibacterota bacterium]